MQAYDRYFFPRGSLARRGARKAIALLRRMAPRLADQCAPLRRALLRRLYDDHADQGTPPDALLGGAASEPSVAAPSERGGARVDRSSNTEAPSFDPSTLRVLHVIGSLQAGGAERQVVYTLTGLRERGFRGAELLVTEGLDGAHGHYREALRKSGVPTSVAGASMDATFESRLAAHPGLADRIRQMPFALRPRVTDLAGEFLVRRPDVLHCWLDHTNIWAGVAAAVVGVPVVILSTRNVSPVHMPHLREPWFEQWYGALARRDGVHFVNNSRAGALDYASWLGLPPERFRVILNGVDFAHMKVPSAEERAKFRADAGLPPKARLLTGVFRMADEKQPHVFVRVAERVLEQFGDVHAVLAGTGRLERTIRALMQRSPHRARMHHLGRRSDVPTILAESEVFLLTSKAEGTPNVLLEAQYLGCPVVTTAAGGAGDAIVNDVTGCVRPIGDEAGLTDAVARLLGDATLRARFAAEGPRWVAAQFGLDRMIDETITLYRDARAGASAREA